MRAGVAGAFFGRNVFQAKNIPELMGLIHLALRSQNSKQGR